MEYVYLENPFFSRIAKSPISWGISCTKIAMAVSIPSLKLVRNEADTANPCTKLSIPLARRFRYPTIGFARSSCWLILSLLLPSSDEYCKKNDSNYITSYSSDNHNINRTLQ